MARAQSLVAAIRDAGDGFVSDTAPLVYRLERSGQKGVLAVVDGLFDAVEDGTFGCLVSTVSAAELLVRACAIGPPAVSVADAFLRARNVGIVEPSFGIAHGAARLVARRVTRRLPDAIVAATAAAVALPLVTADRRLARAVDAFLLQDFARGRT